ncbi:MAG TPA: PIN domain-containing protein [Mucilaginibacter sp.]
MAFKIFLDVNILLDFLLKRDDHYPDARQIMELVISNQIQAFITSSVLHITGYWVAKAYGSEKAKELLLSLLIDIKIIDIPHEVALTALHSKINDIEDALQYYTAIHHQVNYFISRDKQLQKGGIAALPVCSPGEFVKVLI